MPPSCVACLTWTVKPRSNNSAAMSSSNCRGERSKSRSGCCFRAAMRAPWLRANHPLGTYIFRGPRLVNQLQSLFNSVFEHRDSCVIQNAEMASAVTGGSRGIVEITNDQGHCLGGRDPAHQGDPEQLGDPNGTVTPLEVSDLRSRFAQKLCQALLRQVCIVAHGLEGLEKRGSPLRHFLLDRLMPFNGRRHAGSQIASGLIYLQGSCPDRHKVARTGKYEALMDARTPRDIVSGHRRLERTLKRRGGSDGARGARAGQSTALSTSCWRAATGLRACLGYRRR